MHSLLLFCCHLSYRHLAVHQFGQKEVAGFGSFVILGDKNSDLIKWCVCDFIEYF